MKTHESLISAGKKLVVGLTVSFLFAVFGFILVGDTWMQFNEGAQSYFILNSVSSGWDSIATLF